LHRVSHSSEEPKGLKGLPRPSVALKFQKQGTTSEAHGNQHPEHDSNSENFRSHETGFTINIYLTIFPAEFGASS